jgi:TRAP-type transport system small permease protein
MTDLPVDVISTRGPMRQLLDALQRLLEWILIGLLSVLIAFVGLQVLSRQTSLVPTFLWTEEIARFCFVWMILVGSTVAVRENMHFDIDLLPWLSPKNRARLSIVTYLFMLVVGLVFIRYGTAFFLFGKNLAAEISDIPLGIVFIAWPLAGTVWSMFLIEKVYDALRLENGVPQP